MPERAGGRHRYLEQRQRRRERRQHYGAGPHLGRDGCGLVGQRGVHLYLRKHEPRRLSPVCDHYSSRETSVLPAEGAGGAGQARDAAEHPPPGAGGAPGQTSKAGSLSPANSLPLAAAGFVAAAWGLMRVTAFFCPAAAGSEAVSLPTSSATAATVDPTAAFAWAATLMTALRADSRTGVAASAPALAALAGLSAAGSAAFLLPVAFAFGFAAGADLAFFGAAFAFLAAPALGSDPWDAGAVADSTAAVAFAATFSAAAVAVSTEALALATAAALAPAGFAAAFFLISAAFTFNAAGAFFAAGLAAGLAAFTFTGDEIFVRDFVFSCMRRASDECPVP